MALHSEQDFLELIDRLFPQGPAAGPRQAGHVLLGRGDDCAVLRCPERMCVSADLFLEDVHFRRSYFEPEEVGYKALAVNVSDIASMGARPLGFCLQLFGPVGRSGPASPAGQIGKTGVTEEWWARMLAGMADLARGLDLALAGGDLSRGAAVGLAVTVWGEAGPGGRFLQRRTARAGDDLFLVGDVGLARAGLLALESRGREACRELPRATAAHLQPALHVDQALHLGSLDFVRGLMDVSDGLAMDLPRFLPPGLGADLSLGEADLDREIVEFARERGEDPLRFALAGGEDYALLGAAEPGSAGALADAVPGARIIGRVLDAPGIFLASRPAAVGGFDHFAG